MTKLDGDARGGAFCMRSKQVTRRPDQIHRYRERFERVGTVPPRGQWCEPHLADGDIVAALARPTDR